MLDCYEQVNCLALYSIGGDILVSSNTLLDSHVWFMKQPIYTTIL